MGDSPFRAFAERHDLDYAEQVAPGVGSIPRGDAGPVAGGTLPGGVDGLVGDLSQEIKGPGGSGGTTRYFRDCVFVLTRVPESTVFLPYVACRDTVTSGFADRMVGPGGLIPLVDHVEFESTELNRRYRIGALKGTSESRLRQLFSPVLIDWMAHSAPEGLYFELFGGVLLVTVTGKATEEAHVQGACELAAHLAERIRSEASESMLPDGTMGLTSTPMQVEHERNRSDTLAAAAFTSPPDDFQSAVERIEPVVKDRSKGLLRRVFKSINEAEAEDLALEAFMRGYAERRGLSWQRPVDFLARHAGSPLPIAAKQAVRGPLPVVGVEGDLFAFGGSATGNTDGPAFSPGAVIPASDRDAVLQIAPVSVRGEEMSMIGGFQVSITGGQKRISAQSERDAEVATALAGELGGEYTVVAHNCELGWTFTPAMHDWLVAAGRRGESALVLGNGFLTLFSGPVPAEDWSTATLDGFCESLAPLSAAHRSGHA